MQAVPPQQMLLQSPGSPNNSLNSSIISITESDASLIQDGNSVAESDICKGLQSNLASSDEDEVLQPNSLQGLSKRNRATKMKSSVFIQKPRGYGSSPVRLRKQKSRSLHVSADDKDLHNIYRQPKFTLRDFIVEFASASGDVPVSVAEKFTDCGLQKVLEERREPKNTQLSTQQLHLPDDLPEVCKRVPPKQLLIEMAAVIREQLSKVVFC